MLFSRSLAPKICLFLVAFALVSTPAFAGTLTASPNPVTLAAVAGSAPPEAVPVTFTSSAGTAVTKIDSAAITTNATSHGFPIFAVGISGSTLLVGVNASALQGLANGNYDGVVRVVAGADSIDLPVRLSMGTSAQLTLSTTSLTLSAPAGSTAIITQSVTLSSNVNISFTPSVSTTSGGTWLKYLVPSTTATSTGMSVTVNANPAGLAAGSYAGTISFAPTGGSSASAVTLSVTLIIGGSGALYANPSAMTFAFNTSTGIPPAQTLYVTSSVSTSFAAYATTTSGGNWLLVNGSTSTTGTIASGTGAMNVTVAPTGLTAGIYQGNILVYAGSASAQVQVTLSVNTTLSSVTVTPSTISLVSPAGSLSFAAQNLGINATVSGGTFTAQPVSSGWLTLSSTSGALVNGQTPLTVYGNPSGLVASTYSGQILLTFGGTLTGSQVIPVSFVVGSSGSTGGFTTVTPNSLTFYMQKGKAANLVAQTVAVSGVAGTGVTVSGTPTSGGNWLMVNTASGLVPFNATVSIDPTVANTLNANTYSASLTFQSGTGTVTVPVNLVISDAATLMLNPAAITVNYDPGTTLNAQYITLLNSGGSTDSITYTATPTVSWITLYGTTGTIPGGQGSNMAVVITPGGLPAGVNSGAITITASGASNSAVTIPVTVVVSGTQGLTFSPSTMSFTAPVGSSPAVQSLTVSSSSTVTISSSATTTTGGNWLSVGPATTVAGPGASANLSVAVASSTLQAGTYNGTILVSTGTGTQQIPVTLTVGGGTAAGILAVESTNPSFDYLQGAAAPAAQTLLVQSQVAIVSFTATASGGTWLSVTPSSGTTPATLSISVNPQGLGAGTYTGSITVTAPGATNSPQTRTVTLTVRQAATLGVSPNAVSFTYRTDGAVPGGQQLAVSSSGAALTFTSSSNAPWLQVSPATGTTPANVQAVVNPTGLNAGRYNGQIMFSTVGATPPSTVAVDVSLVVSAPLPTVTRITNAASYVDGPVSPGEIVVLFGSFMGPSDIAGLALDSSGRVATTLSDVRVLFNGLPAPLVYVSANQASAVVPYGIAGRTTTSAWLEYRGVRSNSVTLNVATSAPAIFTANASGTGPGAILNQDYSFNSSGNAAARGSVVSLYCTGEGQTIPLGVDGRINNDPNNLPAPVLGVTVMIDNRPARVLYQGAAPSLLSGLMQVNVEVPAGASTGQVPVSVTVGNVTSQPGVTVAVR